MTVHRSVPSRRPVRRGFLLDRRAFLATLTGSLLAAPLAAEAQQAGKVWRIGLFHVGLDHVPPSLDGLRDGLKTLGYEEGKNLQLDFRNVADEAAARVVAVDLARGRPNLLVAFEDQTLRAGPRVGDRVLSAPRGRANSAGRAVSQTGFDVQCARLAGNDSWVKSR